MDKALLSLLKASLGLEKSIKDLVKFYNEQNEIITDISNITSHGQGEWHSGTLAHYTLPPSHHLRTDYHFQNHEGERGFKVMRNRKSHVFYSKASK